MSKQTVTRVLFGLIIAASAVAFLAYPDQSKREIAPAAVVDSRPSVAVTVFPLYDIVRNVAGDDVRVELILPSGANPHTYELTPSALRRLSGIEAIYAIGHGLDEWALAVRDQVHAGYVVVDKGITLRESSEHGDEEEDDHEGEDDHGPIDPHYWLDARNAVTIARTVRDDLSVRFPSHAIALNERFERYAAELMVLDAELRETLSAVSDPHIVTLHDAWYYFADAYGLEVVGTYEPTAAREPTPAYLAGLIQAIRDADVRILFAEPGAGVASIASFVEDNGLEVRVLDPEGGGVPGRESYIELMRYNAATIAQ